MESSKIIVLSPNFTSGLVGGGGVEEVHRVKREILSPPANHQNTDRQTKLK